MSIYAHLGLHPIGNNGLRVEEEKRSVIVALLFTGRRRMIFM